MTVVAEDTHDELIRCRSNLRAMEDACTAYQIRLRSAEGTVDFLIEQLTTIAAIAEGGTTVQSLRNVGKIARAAIAQAEGSV